MAGCALSRMRRQEARVRVGEGGRRLRRGRAPNRPELEGARTPFTRRRRGGSDRHAVATAVGRRGHVRPARPGAAARARLPSRRAACPGPFGRVGTPVRGAPRAGGPDEPSARPLARRSPAKRGPRLHSTARRRCGAARGRCLHDGRDSACGCERAEGEGRGRDVCTRDPGAATRLGRRTTDSS